MKSVCEKCVWKVCVKCVWTVCLKSVCKVWVKSVYKVCEKCVFKVCVKSACKSVCESVCEQCECEKLISWPYQHSGLSISRPYRSHVYRSHGYRHSGLSISWDRTHNYRHFDPASLKPLNCLKFHKFRKFFEFCGSSFNIFGSNFSSLNFFRFAVRVFWFEFESNSISFNMRVLQVLRVFAEFLSFCAKGFLNTGPTKCHY